MARNKYPEITEGRILDAATKLFLEKGYENTTIQDIVDELGDLTRGAVYHHFKSKEEIIEAVSDRLSGSIEPFQRAVDREQTGLDKLRALIRVSTSPERDEAELNISGQMLKQMPSNPRFVLQELDSAFCDVAPMVEQIFELGNRDGSLSVPYPKPAAEVFSLLVTFWFNRDIATVPEEEFLDRVRFLRYLTDSIGIPLLDEEYIEQCRQLLLRFQEMMAKLDGENA